MRSTAQIHEVRIMRFLEINQRFQKKELSCEQAAEILGISLSTFYRQRQRFASDGEAGLVDKRVGKLSAKRVPVDEAIQVISLFQTKYYDFTVKHFHQKLVEQGFNRSYTWVKNTLQEAGVVKKAKKRGQHRRKRPRKPLPGMMIHQDGSTHEWVQGKIWDLIVTMDDATNEIYSMFFCEQEGTMSSFRGLSETIKKRGLPCSLYVDRGSHYFITLEAGEAVDKVRLTQFGRAMRQLGIEMIAAYSPQARGRSERMFGTLQKRLPQELRLRGITDIEEANAFLRDVYLVEHNVQFSQKPEEDGNAFTPLQNCFALEDILCIQEERTVNNDNTVKYKGKILQLIPDNSHIHYTKCKVRVHEYMDGSLAVYHGPRKLKMELWDNGEATKEEDRSDGFIAFGPNSGRKEKGDSTPSLPDFGHHPGAQVAPQRCPILQETKTLSAKNKRT